MNSWSELSLLSIGVATYCGVMLWLLWPYLKPRMGLAVRDGRTLLGLYMLASFLVPLVGLPICALGAVVIEKTGDSKPIRPLVGFFLTPILGQKIVMGIDAQLMNWWRLAFGEALELKIAYEFELAGKHHRSVKSVYCLKRNVANDSKFFGGWFPWPLFNSWNISSYVAGKGQSLDFRAPNGARLFDSSLEFFCISALKSRLKIGGPPTHGNLVPIFYSNEKMRPVEIVAYRIRSRPIKHKDMLVSRPSLLSIRKVPARDVFDFGDLSSFSDQEHGAWRPSEMYKVRIRAGKGNYTQKTMVSE